jgi:hypothetical protein
MSTVIWVKKQVKYAMKARFRELMESMVRPIGYRKILTLVFDENDASSTTL